MISRNYHHIASHPVLSDLFPSENLMGGSQICLKYSHPVYSCHLGTMGALTEIVVVVEVQFH